jgi:Holliday junction resolvase RusA-like endonuclease
MSAVRQMNPGAVSGERACAAGGEQSSSAIVTLTLPAPPSANALFQNVKGKGRCRTKLYDDWIGHAGWKLREQEPPHVLGHVVIIFGIERTSSFADIDNRLKAALDLLVKHQVIQDDRFVTAIAIAWNPPRDRLMRLLITPAADLAVRFQLASDGATGGWFLDAPSQAEGAIQYGD